MQPDPQVYFGPPARVATAQRYNLVAIPRMPSRLSRRWRGQNQRGNYAGQTCRTR